MKIQFERKSFLAQLKFAASVCPKAHITPILTCVKIVANKKHGTIIHATDKEMGIRIKVDADVLEPGVVLVPADRLIKKLSGSKQEQLVLEIRGEVGKETKLVMWGNLAGQWEFPIDHKPHEYPNVADFNTKSYHLIDSNNLLKAINRTIFAADKAQVSIRNINCVCFECTKHKKDKYDTISAVATDGRIMAVQEFPATCCKDHCFVSTVSNKPSISIPIKPLLLVEKLLKDKTNANVAVAMSINKDTVTFQFNNTVIFAHLHKGAFVAWRDVFWDANKYVTAATGCRTLRSAIETVATGLKDPCVVMMFDNHGTLTLEVNEKGIGRSKTTVPAVCDGQVTVGISAKHLLDILKVLDPATSLTFYMDGDNGIIVNVSNDCRYIIMPRLGEPKYHVEKDGQDIGEFNHEKALRSQGVPGTKVVRTQKSKNG